MSTAVFSSRHPRKWQAPLLVAAGLLMVVFTLVLIDTLVIQPAFLQLEQREALEDNSRARSALDQELKGLSNLTLDWANWDDSYVFVEHPNQAFIDSACPDAADLSSESQIDLLVYVHRDGRIIFNSVYNPMTREKTNLSFVHQDAPILQTLLNSILNSATPRKGILDTEQGLMLLVAAGIHTSERNGETRGLLLMGRFLNQTILAKLRQQTKVGFVLHAAKTLTAGEQEVFNQLQQLPPESRPLLREGCLYQLIKNIEGRPIALLRTDIRGEITALGKHMGRFLASVLGAISLVLLIWLSIYRHRMQLAHLELQISEDRYRQLFEAESDAIFLINNTTGQILEANKAASQLYQYTRQELLQYSESDLSAEPENARWLVAEPFCAESNEQLISIPLRLHQKKDGTIFPVEITGRIFCHKKNSFFITAIRDISKRVQMEREQAELEVLNRQLHKEESLGRMAGAIAHHFNNQLMTVAGFIQMAIDQNLSAEAAKDLHTALEAVRKATSISTLMQSYVGISGCQRQATDLAAACRGFLPMLLPLVPESIQFNTDLPDPGPISALNIDQLQQMLTNLMTNSIEALENQPPDHPGTINLRVKIMENIPLEHRYKFPVNWRPTDVSYACLEVNDNGCGIALDVMEKLFDPFYTTKFTGRGLGLALVLGLAKAHQGAILVDSAPGRGSTFKVLFPLLP
nr:CHASE4 domain-containing protein [uncultured Desulfobulbus sp.]